MKRVCLAMGLAVGVFAQPNPAQPNPAQSNRDAYRGVYRAWREADPNLEQDAGAGGTAFGERAGRAAAQAAAYATERTAFLKQLAGENETGAAVLENATAIHPPSLSPDSFQRYVADESAATAHYIEIFAKDSDRGIQLLRQALDQERSALAALRAAIVERGKAAGVVQDAESVAEQVRREALEVRSDLVAGLKQAAEQTNGDAAAWVEYYRSLAAGAPATATLPTEAGNPIRPANPAAPPLTPAITPVPLVRYTGAWTYPSTNGLYHGPQPQFIDLGVREENGRASGTLFARFKLPPGTAGDPELRFEFSGEFKNTRTQVFSVVTADGAKGTIELIPGPAFNLLEVNFQTEPRPGKVQRANMVLVKK